MTAPDRSRNKILDRRPAGISLFPITLLIAFLVMPLADAVVCDYLIFDYEIYIQEVFRHPVIFFGVLGPIGFFLGWLIYLTLAFLAIRFDRNHRIFWWLYTGFVSLLAVNIGFVLIFTLSLGRSFGYSC
jgi:hypothetical protein